MGQNIVGFTGVTPGQLAAHFKLSAEDDIGRAVVNLIFKVLRNDCAVGALKGHERDQDKEAFDAVVRMLEEPLRIYRKYAPDFFEEGYPVDRDALMVAVLGQTFRSHYFDTPFQIPGIDEKTMSKVHALWSEKDLCRTYPQKIRSPEIQFMFYTSSFFQYHRYERSRTLDPELHKQYETLMRTEIHMTLPMLDDSKEMCRDLSICLKSVADEIGENVHKTVRRMPTLADCANEP